jgi:mRNA-degrading endonuclease RelE of RelBE toxin-antitoxin system
LYSLEVDSKVDRALMKLSKKDPEQSGAVHRKIREILENPLQFKPLRRPLEGARRVHIGHFVLIFDVVGSTVRLLKYEHHDDVYK